MNDLYTKLQFRRELPRHLHELALLVGRPVDETELLSLDETNLLRDRSNNIARATGAKFTIPFEEKQDPRFRRFLAQLSEANPSDVYFWTPASNRCGLLRPHSLKELRPDFPFDLNPDGIFVVITSDLADELVLDYSLGDNDEQLLEVETSGAHWGRVQF